MAAPNGDPPADHRAGYARKLLLTVAVGALALVAYQWRHVFLLVFGATLVAVALRSAADPLRRRLGLGASASLGLTLLLVITGVVAAGWFVGAQLAEQVRQLQAALPQAWATATRQIGAYTAGQWLLDRLHASAAGWMNGGLGPLAGHLGHATSVGVQAVGEFVIVLVGGVYFAAQPRLYRDSLLSLAPPALRKRLADCALACDLALRKWLLGVAAAMLAMGMLTAVGAALLGLPAPLALGLLSGLAEFVPIVGAAVSAIPGLLLAATKGAHTLLETTVFYVAVHQFEGHVLIPLIQKRVVAVPPALTLFAIVGFGVLFGPSGVVFATPLVVVVLILLRTLYLSPSAPDVADAAEATTPVGARGRL
jgi:predicted PurR-regulated permease PerM